MFGTVIIILTILVAIPYAAMKAQEVRAQQAIIDLAKRH